MRSLPVPFTFEQVAARTQQNAGALTARRRRSRPPAKRIDGGRDSGLVVPGAGLVDLTDQRAVGRTPDPTNGDGVEADGDNGAFSVDFTISGTAPRTTVSGGPPRGSDAFLREWERELGDSCRPVGNPAADFQVRSRAAKVRDVVIINLHGVSAVRSESIPPPFEEQVRMFVVRRGAGRGTVGATVATRPFSGGQLLHPRVGGLGRDAPAVAHSNMVHETVADLSGAGVDAARSSLLELAKAMAIGRFDDVEPRLAPALTQAARELVYSHARSTGAVGD